MAEFMFYHQTRTGFEATVPVLAARAAERGWRVVLRAPDPALAAWLDERLWLGEAEGFLPHGLADAPFAADQPLLITTGLDAPNGAQMLMTVGGAPLAPSDADFARVCVIFDGNNPAAVEIARGQWKEVVAAGHPARYWSQESGRWACKASRNL